MKRKAARRMASARDTAGGGIRAVVSDPPFSARGDGKTNDRAAIQRAIDLAASEGGGSVILPSGGTYLSGGVITKYML